MNNDTAIITLLIELQSDRETLRQQVAGLAQENAELRQQLAAAATTGDGDGA